MTRGSIKEYTWPRYIWRLTKRRRERYWTNLPRSPDYTGSLQFACFAIVPRGQDPPAAAGLLALHLDPFQRAISRSLDVSRATIRKYVYAAEARGYRQGDPTPPQGWKAFIVDVIPRPPDAATRSPVFAALLPYQDEIKAALATTKAPKSDCTWNTEALSSF